DQPDHKGHRSKRDNPYDPSEPTGKRIGDFDDILDIVIVPGRIDGSIADPDGYGIGVEGRSADHKGQPGYRPGPRVKAGDREVLPVGPLRTGNRRVRGMPLDPLEMRQAV